MAAGLRATRNRGGVVSGYDLERLEALLKEALLDNGAGPWYEEGAHLPRCPACSAVSENPKALPVGAMLCYFPDEGEPRFWNYDVDGCLWATTRNALPSMLSDLRLLKEARDSGALEWALFLAEAECGGVRVSYETEGDKFTRALRALHEGGEVSGGPEADRW